MPPLYSWLDRKSDITVDIIRHYTDIELPPTIAEAVEDGMTEEQHAAADWERVLSAATVIRAPGFGSKGNW